VEFEFDSPDLRTGLLLHLAGFALLALYGAGLLVARHRASAAPREEARGSP
jgi:hypothetical protein